MELEFRTQLKIIYNNIFSSSLYSAKVSTNMIYGISESRQAPVNQTGEKLLLFFMCVKKSRGGQ